MSIGSLAIGPENVVVGCIRQYSDWKCLYYRMPYVHIMRFSLSHVHLFVWGYDPRQLDEQQHLYRGKLHPLTRCELWAITGGAMSNRSSGLRPKAGRYHSYSVCCPTSWWSDASPYSLSTIKLGVVPEPVFPCWNIEHFCGGWYLPFRTPCSNMLTSTQLMWLDLFAKLLHCSTYSLGIQRE